jgi:hypothetical protein
MHSAPCIVQALLALQLTNCTVFLSLTIRAVNQRRLELSTRMRQVFSSNLNTPERRSGPRPWECHGIIAPSSGVIGVMSTADYLAWERAP